MAKVNTNVTLPNGTKGVTTAPVDSKGKQEVWVESSGKTVSVPAKDLK
jgi:hypothetical protein